MLPLYPSIIHIRLLIFAALCFGLTACAAVAPNPRCVDNGEEITIKPYIAFDDADEYFERGKAYAAYDGCMCLAIEDFELAIARYDTDRWRMRIRGDWPVEYFPHRELGIAYYKRGRYPEAEKELLASLEDAHSDRAVFFLERTRRAIVNHRRPTTTIPSIQVSWGGKTHRTNADLVVLTGTVQDANYIAEFSIDGRSEYLIGNPSSHRFRRVFPSLPQGRHTIPMRAVNLIGGETTEMAVIYVDRHGPTIGIQSQSPLTTQQGPLIEITGFLEDESGLAKLEINNHIIEALQGRRQVFTKRFSKDQGQVTLVAYDRIGNQTRMVIPLGAPNATPSAGAALLASADDQGLRSPIFATKSGGDEGLSFTDYFSNIGPDALKVYQKEVILPIEVQTGQKGLSSAHLKIFASCKEQNASVSEGNSEEKPWYIAQVHGELPPGLQRRLDIPLALHKGENLIVLEAVIPSPGNSQDKILTSDRICLSRIEPGTLRDSQKVPLTITTTSQEHKHFVRQLKIALTRTGRFKVVNTPTAGWQLTEIEKNIWGEEEDSTSAKDTEYAATLRGPDEAKTERGYPSLYMEGEVKTKTEIMAAAEAFADRLLLEFPLLRGSVQQIRQAGKTVTSDIAYVRPLEGRNIKIFRQYASVSPSGVPQLRGEPRVIAHAHIEKMDLLSTEADVFMAHFAVKKYDQVITDYALAR